ncbi:MAG: hypothetical protein CR967_03575 [Proteobacteria bacterium]|nr:MAG: hypothetical protein CR967_03575 [Pseudomonadota bacterium]
MLRFITLFITLQVFIFAQNTLPFEIYQGRLLDIKENQGTIEDSPLIKVGSSGIIMHSFDGEKSAIVASVIVTKKEGDFAFVKIEKFKMLKQPAFPEIGISAQKGDEVILNYLYNRSLIVAPNERIYKKVTSHFPHMQWVHPDLMAAYLASDYKPNPSKYNFDVMCSQNSAGLVFFALNEKGFFVDCQSLKILQSYDLEEIKEYQLPFYNRIGEVDTIFWKFTGSKIKDYNKFYSKLLGLK